MRNWNTGGKVCIGMPGWIHILPMRNWNNSFSVNSVASSIIHILPMRNWNYLSSNCTRLPLTFTSYLWGIETLWSCEKRESKKWFTSYLWGIETDPRIDRFMVRQNSHPTYEELKLMTWKGISRGGGLIHILPMRNWNSKSVKKRLKDSIHSHPTYEELKQASKPTNVFVILIHILPMRNWNSFTPIQFDTTTEFTSYLWGIET